MLLLYHRAWGVSTGGDLYARDPCPERVLRALAPLWPSLYTALEWATQQTRAYFDAEGTPIDRHLAPSLVRYQAKRHLAHLGHDAQEEEGEAYAFQTLPTMACPCPIAGSSVCAAHSESPGGPAASARGLASPPSLLHQQLIFDYAAPSAAELRPSLNLLVLWETDAVYPCGGCRWCVRRSGP